MIAAAHTISLNGIDGTAVKVEAKLGAGLASTTIVGLADTALKESRERLRAALHSCQIPALGRRLTINLSPASLPKTGSSFDLPIAVAVLAARGIVDGAVTEGTVFAAELGLDGSVRATPSVLAQAWVARQQGFKRIVVAAESLEEAREITGIEVVGCHHLRELVSAFRPGAPGLAAGWHSLQRGLPAGTKSHPGPQTSRTDTPDLLDVRGQPEARRRCVIAAVGGHHLLLHGDAGSGKTMLAERMGTLLPDLDGEDAMILAAMRSAADQPETTRLDFQPPLQIVGPTTTATALVGGGGRHIKPGIISLAHGGVLVLNEAPDFAPRVLDALRGPLDTGEVTIRRATGAVSFPARFQLVMTANQCPCGMVGEDAQCSCSPVQQRRYRQRISGPLLDRIDMQIHVEHPGISEIQDDRPLDSATARQQVIEARERSRYRWAEDGYELNSQIPGTSLRRHSKLPRAFVELLDRSVAQGALSLRAADRILRVAWSAADLHAHEWPTGEDLSLALDLRTRGMWGQI